MKKLILSLISTLTLCFVAQAQLVTVIEGGTNNVLGNTANTYSNYLDVSKQDNVRILFSFKSYGGAASSNVTATFVPASSADGLGDDLNAPINVVLAANGTTKVQVYTNLNVTGAQYLKLITIANTNGAGGGTTNAITNLTIGYTVKQLSRP